MLCARPRLNRTVMASTNAMETEDSNHLPSSNLRRSNSAPMIGGANVNDHAPVFQPQLMRQRRFSTSQMAINGPVGSPASRVAEIKREESGDDMSREALQERVVLQDIRLSQSWDEGLLMDQDNHRHDVPMRERRNSLDDPHNHFSTAMSPTRFPVRAHVPVRATRSLTPSPSPSPTRQTFAPRRSLSPSPVLRPSTLTLKRKCPSEGFEPGVSPSKRVYEPAVHNNQLEHEEPCETAHLQFDIDHMDHNDSSTVNTNPPTSTQMVFGDLHRPFYRPRFTPPRSPLAGPSTTQNHIDTSRALGNTPSCFTFAPVRD